MVWRAFLAAVTFLFLSSAQAVQWEHEWLTITDGSLHAQRAAHVLARYVSHFVDSATIRTVVVTTPETLERTLFQASFSGAAVLANSNAPVLGHLLSFGKAQSERLSVAEAETEATESLRGALSELSRGIAALQPTEHMLTSLRLVHESGSLR
jgi:hypothetical protein